jgi:Na+-driven multidrug efflux pump
MSISFCAHVTGAASTRVSNELGAGRTKPLVAIVAAATILAVLISVGSAVISIVAR